MSNTYKELRPHKGSHPSIKGNLLYKYHIIYYIMYIIYTHASILSLSIIIPHMQHTHKANTWVATTHALFQCFIVSDTTYCTTKQVLKP